MGKNKFPYLLTIRLLFLVLFIHLSISLNISCDNNGQGSSTVGPQGGSVSSTDGRLILDIPPGALTEDTEIIIIRLPGR